MKRNSIFSNALSLLALLLFTFAFYSCSDVDSSTGGGTVAFSFTGQQLLSRNIAVSESEGYYLLVSLRGDYTDYRSIAVTDATASYSVTFNSLPLGSSVYLEANVYNPSANPEDGDDAYLHIWTGRSDSFTVSQGENKVRLSMKDLTANDSEWHVFYDAPLKAFAENVYYNGVDVSENAQRDGSLSLYGFSNGKYQILLGDEGDKKIVSEGTWSWITENESIYLTECIYKQVRMSDDEFSLSSPVIVTYPTARAYVGTKPEYSSYNEMREFTFTSENGLKIKFMLEPY